MPQSEKEPILVGASTVIVTFWPPPALTLPEDWLIWHQVAGLPATPEAVQFRVALPVLEIFKVLPAGVSPPDMPLKEKDAGLKTMWGLLSVNVAVQVLLPSIVTV